jgi:hypothetical protein
VSIDRGYRPVHVLVLDVRSPALLASEDVEERRSSMTYDAALAERVRGRLGDRQGVTERTMFGGPAFLEHGHLVVGVHGDDLVVRLERGQVPEALRRAGARPFDLTGRPLSGWLLVRGDGLSDDELDGWLTGARDFVATLPPA